MEQTAASHDLCILVVSCDAYADCWEPFSLCMQKFWPDCPYPVYLATERRTAPEGTVFQKPVHSTHSSWTGRLREFCQQIQESHLLLVLEDQWVSRPVSSETIQKITRTILSDDSIGIIYLDYAVKSFPRWEGDPSFYVIPAGTPYRLSVGPSLWNREFLLAICRENVDAWNFERVQSFSPVSYMRTVLVSATPVYCRVPPLGAIRRGKWEPSVPTFCSENHIPLDFSQRKVLGFGDTVKVAVKSLIFNLNPSLIVKVQNWLYNLQKSRH